MRWLLICTIGTFSTASGLSAGDTFENYVHTQVRGNESWVNRTDAWAADIEYNFTTVYDGTDFTTDFEIKFSSGLQIPAPDRVNMSASDQYARIALTGFGMHIPHELAYCSSGKNLDGDCYTDQELKDSTYPLHIAMSRTLLGAWKPMKVSTSAPGVHEHCMLSEVDAFCDSKSSCEALRVANPDFWALFKTHITQIGKHDQVLDNAGITVEDIICSSTDPVCIDANSVSYPDGISPAGLHIYNSHTNFGDFSADDVCETIGPTYNVTDCRRRRFSEDFWKKTYKGFKNGNLVSNTDAVYSARNMDDPHRLFDTVFSKPSRVYTSLWLHTKLLDLTYDCTSMDEHIEKFDKLQYVSSPVNEGVTEEHSFVVTSGVPTAPPTQSPIPAVPVTNTAFYHGSNMDGVFIETSGYEKSSTYIGALGGVAAALSAGVAFVVGYGVVETVGTESQYIQFVN